MRLVILGAGGPPRRSDSGCVLDRAHLKPLRVGSEVSPPHPERDVDQPDKCGNFNQRPTTPTNASPEFRPKTATATAIASSKLLPAAVNERVADCA